MHQITPDGPHHQSVCLRGLRRQNAPLLLTFPILATAQTAEEKGLEIVSKAIEADRGFGSSSVDLKMVLKNKYLVYRQKTYLRPLLYFAAYSKSEGTPCSSPRQYVLLLYTK